MSNLKIIFTGPVRAGKTTAISTLSDEAAICTNESATDMTKSRKPDTTVAMDYGVMNLDGTEKIHLYGTPGQERFNFMWDILTTNGLGLVLLLDNTRKDPLKDMQFFIQAFRPFIDETALAIGITRTDVSSTPRVNLYTEKLRELDLSAPLFSTDARNYDDVSMLVQSLLFTIDPGLV
ncbi:MAG: ATP/GTP-binding protein [Pseudomonadales bacterium]|nr:ATP/GTP-binding protein [Pseudomonadales bacterium]